MEGTASSDYRVQGRKIRRGSVAINSNATVYGNGPGGRAVLCGLAVPSYFPVPDVVQSSMRTQK